MCGQQGVEVVGQQPRSPGRGVGGVALNRCASPYRDGLCRSEIICSSRRRKGGGFNGKGRGGLTAGDGDGGEEIS